MKIKVVATPDNIILTVRAALSINAADATKLTALRGCGRHRYRRRSSSDGAQKSQLVHRGDFEGLKSDAEARQTEAVAIHNFQTKGQVITDTEVTVAENNTASLH